MSISCFPSYKKTKLWFAPDYFFTPIYLPRFIVAIELDRREDETLKQRTQSDRRIEYFRVQRILSSAAGGFEPSEPIVVESHATVST